MLIDSEAHQKVTTAHYRGWHIYTCASPRYARSWRTPRALIASTRYGAAQWRWAGRSIASS